MGTHNLITGLNGHGKTLYAVSTTCTRMQSETFTHRGQVKPRRLVVGGVRGLALTHEVMEVPELDPESFVDTWGQYDRKAGDPVPTWVVPGVRDKLGGWERRPQLGYTNPHPDEEGGELLPPGAEPVVCSILNWWLWAQPGDLIMIDEAQSVFRPMASGRRVPRFIARLEIARHYGVEFVYITQTPGLLHGNVRRLAGPHQDIQRIWGGMRTVIYEWPRAANDPSARSGSVMKFWKHDKKAFNLYKSAEVHHNFTTRKPLAVYLLMICVPVGIYAAWNAYSKVTGNFHRSAVAESAPGTPGAASAPLAGNAAERTAARSAGQVVSHAVWPVLNASTAKVDREPYHDRGVHAVGCYFTGELPVCSFIVSVNGRTVAYLSGDGLRRAGYGWRMTGPCAFVLTFNGRERSVTCDAPSSAPPSVPGSPASGAYASL